MIGPVAGVVCGAAALAALRLRGRPVGRRRRRTRRPRRGCTLHPRPPSQGAADAGLRVAGRAKCACTRSDGWQWRCWSSPSPSTGRGRGGRRRRLLRLARRATAATRLRSLRRRLLSSRRTVLPRLVGAWRAAAARCAARRPGGPGGVPAPAPGCGPASARRRPPPARPGPAGPGGARAGGARATSEAAMSKRTSARVFERLACWPPGPPLGVKRHSSSRSGIAHVRVTRSTSPSIRLRSRKWVTATSPAGAAGPRFRHLVRPHVGGQRLGRPARATPAARSSASTCSATATRRSPTIPRPTPTSRRRVAARFSPTAGRRHRLLARRPDDPRPRRRAPRPLRAHRRRRRRRQPVPRPTTDRPSRDAVAGTPAPREPTWPPATSASSPRTPATTATRSPPACAAPESRRSPTRPGPHHRPVLVVLGDRDFAGPGRSARRARCRTPGS